MRHAENLVLAGTSVEICTNT